MMKELIDNMHNGNLKKIESLLEELKSDKGIAEKDLVLILKQLPILVKRFRKTFVIERKGENITWYEYETLIWTFGEVFRQVLQKYRGLRRKEELLHNIEMMCKDKQFGKGRESYIMLLGQYGGPERIPVLIELLDDQEIQGHAVYSLRLLGAVEAEKKMYPFLHHEKSWIRKEAKKYYTKIGKNPTRN